MTEGIAAQSVAGLSIAAQAIAAAGTQQQGYVTQYLPGSYTFQPPKSGLYQFIMWGAGGPGDGVNPGGSGSYCEKAFFLTRANGVPIVVGSNGNNTTVTLPNGQVVTAGGGATNAAGVASGGDVNLNGSLPGVNGLGTGGGIANASAGGAAPANLPFRGARSQLNDGIAPGGGGQSFNGAPGGDGLVLALFVRP